MKECTNQKEWDGLVDALKGHPLQYWSWGEVKARHGWNVRRFLLDDAGGAGAQVLIKTLPKPFNAIAYVPRGPVGKWTSAQLEVLGGQLKKEYGAVCIKIEPDQEVITQSRGWRRSAQTILLPRTVLLDLTKSDDELLAAMAKKTRQYIRKSDKDVVIRRAEVNDLDACLAIYKETAKRANFSLHGDEYYKDIFTLLGDHSPIYVAEDREGAKIVAFLWLAASTSTAFELYGGVNDRGQALRANYALKWHAIQDLKSKGLARYDLNGLLNDGISDFKRSFTNKDTLLAGTYDLPLSPLYPVWDKALPTGKKVYRTLRGLKRG